MKEILVVPDTVFRVIPVEISGGSSVGRHSLIILWKINGVISGRILGKFEEGISWGYLTKHKLK